MTIEEWADRANFRLTYIDNRTHQDKDKTQSERAVAIPISAGELIVERLFRLSDYVVSSVTAGCVWLVPRKKGEAVRFKHELHKSPLDIPEGVSGEYAVVHRHDPPGSKNKRSTPGGVFFAGHPDEEVPTGERRWHLLNQGGVTWTSDVPAEQAAQDRCLLGLSGRVLVGGLGVGYAATKLCLMKAVKEVVVVEISSDVIALVWPHLKLGGKAGVIHDDLHAYLAALPRSKKPRFDHAFYDVWRTDTEADFLGQVVPLLRASDGRVRGKPRCWAEDVMRGRLLSNLHLVYEFTKDSPDQMALAANPETCGSYSRWAVPFFQWALEARPDQKTFSDGAKVYVYGYGIPGCGKSWEDFKKSCRPCKKARAE